MRKIFLLFLVIFFTEGLPSEDQNESNTYILRKYEKQIEKVNENEFKSILRTLMTKDNSFESSSHDGEISRLRPERQLLIKEKTYVGIKTNEKNESKTQTSTATEKMSDIEKFQKPDQVRSSSKGIQNYEKLKKENSASAAADTKTDYTTATVTSETQRASSKYKNTSNNDEEIVEKEIPAIAEDAVECTGLDMDETSKEGLEIMDVNTSENKAAINHVDEEIKEVPKSSPISPIFTLSNNKSHFVFQKDLEKAALEERITQIARQLAETSYKLEFEEKKLGHHIPIQLRSLNEEARQPVTQRPGRFGLGKSINNHVNIPSVVHQLPRQYKTLPVLQHIYKRRFFLPAHYPHPLPQAEVMVPN